MLGDSMASSGTTGADVAAALDMARSDVRDIRAAEKPLEVGHLLLLPHELQVALLARMVASLSPAAQARLVEEMHRARLVRAEEAGAA
jgi:hypothetical protein